MNCQKLKMERKKKIEEEIKRIAGSFSSMNIKKALLFGSVARNDIGINSDIDLLIIMVPGLSFLDRLVTVYKQLNPQISLDLLVYTPEEIEKMKERTFIREIFKEGVVLFEKN